MPYKRQKKLQPPRAWMKTAMADVSNQAVNLIKARTFDQGKGLNDQHFKAYSKAPIYIPMTGVMPKPTGGRVTASGKSMHFKRGYRQYRFLALGYAKVNFMGSGNLRRKFRVLQVSARKGRAVIGISGRGDKSATAKGRAPARLYGLYLHQKRPWLGLSRKDQIKLRRYWQRLINEAFRGVRR